jgi:ribokinase
MAFPHAFVTQRRLTPIVYTYIVVYKGCSCGIGAESLSRIAVVGSYGVGMTMVLPRVPGAGETVLGGDFARGPGGKGSNQAICARRLGAEVDLLTSVGPDDFGREARELWREEGVRAGHVKTGVKATMVGFILLEPGGENRIAVAAGALGELSPEDVEGFATVIREADLCLVSLEIPVQTAVAALRAARAAGTVTLLNPAPASPLPEEAWGLIDLLTPNISEARILAGVGSTSGPEEIVSALRARFDGSVVLTMGSEGALVDDGRGQTHVPPVAAERVVDTTGAGDAFSAALGVATADGRPLLEAARFAAAAGALAVGAPEVIPALPYRHDVDALTESMTP